MYTPTYKILKAFKEGPNGESFFICRRKPSGDFYVGTSLLQVQCFHILTMESSIREKLRDNFLEVLSKSEPHIVEAFLKTFSADMVGALHTNFEFFKINLELM